MSLFTEKNYNSDDGMITSIWGPPLWHSLHTISFNYPIKPTKEQKQDYYNFYNSLKNILPCRFCRDNLKNNLKELPLTLDVMESRKTLSKWVYDLHEHINKMLGKKSNLSYNMVRERYEQFRSRCLVKKPVKKIETGCVEPLYGIKSKCILNIVPKTSHKNTFKIDPKCKIKKL
jgi:hypothetical protein